VATLKSNVDVAILWQIIKRKYNLKDSFAILTIKYVFKYSNFLIAKDIKIKCY